MEILYKNNDIVVISKPAGVPSQPDPSCDMDTMSLCRDALSSMGEKNSDLYLVHRLDRVVGGILVFARNKRACAELSALISGRTVEKEYMAVVDGEAEGGALSDYLYKDNRVGKSFVTDKKRPNAKLAYLEYAPLSKCETKNGVKTLVSIKLSTGRFHQIRAQFSSRGLSITGDGKYGSKDVESRFPALFACGLKFELFSKKYEFKKMPDINKYPWSLFDYD